MYETIYHPKKSRLGQTETQIVMYPGYPGYAYPSYTGQYQTHFIKKAESVPGQPYQFTMSDEEVDKEVYKDVKLNEEVVNKESSDVDPNVLIMTKSGLKVPAYILQRDRQRRQAEQILEKEAGEKKPIFKSAGEYISQNPGRASITSLGLGYILGTLLL